MKTLILKDLVKNSSSVDEGFVLFDHLKNAYLNGEVILLEVDSDLALSSSFLNSSIGAFLDDFGFTNFQKTVKFKGSKNQFERLKSYVEKYRGLYLA
ncbi:STAS-like domain-containing protein [Muricauda oceani]|uniref:STAS-like domain-containing protein n=1 Tax=Flagellimonas oceani TaxID=2698672 RepID=A0A6G7J760_9FLAO|nr:DUF4325 domain-containing protein [Allomuricauda oceani]MBW8242507.1 STAS-like domain-containing protein [Allomuricauda oceani]QII46267.1 STAS-like domain-containing protein [Allomuricauda oceani]